MKAYRKTVFFLLTMVMASSFAGKVYAAGMTQSTRNAASVFLSKAGEKLGYRRINLDARLIALTKEELKYVNSKIDEQLEVIITKDMNDTEKARKIYDFVVENLEYDYSTVNNSAYQAIKEGRTMCAGYSQLFYLMSKRAGLISGYRIGEAGNDLHIWNTLMIDSKLYNIDTTWADKNIAARYKYFMIDDAELSKTHIWSK